MESFLAPIEKPEGFGMKLAYFFTKKKFGKVLTPLKVHSARLPFTFGTWYAKISSLDKKLTLPAELVLLIRQRIAQLNLCLYCIDASRSVAIKESLFDANKFEDLATYQSSSCFSAAEKAALDYVSKLTVEKRIDDANLRKLGAHYSERQVCEIVYLVASEHVYNMTNIGMNIHSDLLCNLTRRR